jgi:hypothetical protein
MGKIALRVLGLEFEVEFESKEELDYLLWVLPNILEKIRQEAPVAVKHPEASK